MAADASDPSTLESALVRVREELGAPRLIVNAVSAARPTGGGPFGGGSIADADLDAFRGWTGAVAEQAFVFLSTGLRALRRSGGGTLVQVTGGPHAAPCPAAGSGRPAARPPGLWSTPPPKRSARRAFMWLC